MRHAQCTTEKELEEAAIYLMRANRPTELDVEFAADAISPNHNLRAAAATTIATLTARTPQQHENSA